MDESAEIGHTDHSSRLSVCLGLMFGVARNGHAFNLHLDSIKCSLAFVCKSSKRRRQYAVKIDVALTAPMHMHIDKER